jgi:signal transduction histidine kinase
METGHDAQLTHELAHELAHERAARIQAEAASRARDEFLTIVSHELRAPLNGIQCWSHIIESQVADLEQAVLLQRAVKGIKTGISQQARLIEDLLDATRMLGGKLRLLMQPVTLLPLIQSTVAGAQEAAASRRIRLASDYRIADEQVEGDPDRIRQVLANLLSNALKFTSAEGNVLVRAVGRGRYVDITVEDDGIGIAPDFLPHLFDRFNQQDAGQLQHQHQGGLRLGLFLVRHLVELHGGTVSAQSGGHGAGSAFTVTLPKRARER